MSARAALALAAAGLAVAWAAPARAARLPDWAKEIAATAPEVPDGVPEWSFRCLLDDTRLTISHDGAAWRWHERLAVQVLSGRADAVQWAHIDRDENAKVRSSKGWHLPPGEKAERAYGRAIDVAASSDFSSDQKSRLVLIGDARKGSLLFYEFDYDDPRVTLNGQHIFGSTSGPIDVERETIELPEGWHLKWAWLRSDGGPPQRSGDTWTFELRNEKPPKEERLGPPAADRLPILVFGALPPEGETAKLPALRTWDDEARWESGLYRGKDAADGAVRKSAEAAFAKAGADPARRIEQAARVVRDRVRYLAREIGIGGFAPQAASDTFAQAIGDCKAKATLFRSYLGVAGLPSYTVLVNASSPDTVADSVPTPFSFDHVIAAVPWPGGPVPPESAPAVADVPGVGKVLIVDTTDDHASPGTAPYYLAGKKALLVDGDRGILFTIPDGTPEANRVETTVTATARPDRSLSAKVEVRYYGAPAEFARASRGNDALARERTAKNEIRESFGGGEVQGYAVTPERADGAFVETFTVALRPGAPELGDGSVGVFPGVMRDFTRVPLSRRTLPVVYPYPIRHRYEVTLAGTTGDAPLPEPASVSGDGWSVATTYERRDGAVHATCTFDRSRVRFEPADFGELKKLWSSASRASALRLPIAP